MAKRRAPPGFVEPMTAKVVTALPDGPGWLYEVKLDGYHALIVKDGARVRIVSRNEKDLTAAYPGVAAAGAKLQARAAAGHPSFQARRPSRSRRRHRQAARVTLRGGSALRVVGEAEAR